LIYINAKALYRKEQTDLKEQIREVGAGKYDDILNLDQEFFILTE
jgi:hypothetical protein